METCKAPKCGRESKRYGYCGRHYLRAQQTRLTGVAKTGLLSKVAVPVETRPAPEKTPRVDEEIAANLEGLNEEEWGRFKAACLLLDEDPHVKLRTFIREWVATVRTRLDQEPTGLELLKQTGFTPQRPYRAGDPGVVSVGPTG